MKYNKKTRTAMIDSTDLYYYNCEKKKYTLARHDEINDEEEIMTSRFQYEPFMNWLVDYSSNSVTLNRHRPDSDVFDRMLECLSEADHLIIDGNGKEAIESEAFSLENTGSIGRFKDITIINVPEIQEHAFKGCMKADKMTIGNGTTLDAWSLAGSHMKNIVLNDVKSDEGNGIIPSCFCFGNTDLITVECKTPIYRINNDAFAGCKNLQNMDLSNIKEIETGAFYDCQSFDLSNQYFASLQTLEPHAFDNCLVSNGQIMLSADFNDKFEDNFPDGVVRLYFTPWNKLTQKEKDVPYQLKKLLEEMEAEKENEPEKDSLEK